MGFEGELFFLKNIFFNFYFFFFQISQNIDPAITDANKTVVA